MLPALFPADELEGLPEDPWARRAAIRAGNRGKGRPKGAVNKSTSAWRDVILEHYGSPLVGLAETWARPVADLAAELGCTLIEAFDRQQRARVESLPYLHGKMPVDVNLNAGGLIGLTIVTGEPAAAREPAKILGGEILQIQEVDDEVERG